MVFVVDKVAMGHVFSEYFGFPCQLSFHRLLHIHHLLLVVGKIGQVMAEVPSRLSLTPSQETKIEIGCMPFPNLSIHRFQQALNVICTSQFDILVTF
jgi:hypothetical protein